MNDMTPIAPVTLGKLAKALAAAQAEMKPAAKDANNPHFKSKYADLEAVNEAARVLATHGIAVMCVPDGWNENRIVIRAMLVHESGEMMEGRLEVPVSQPNNPQALGSAMTYGRRYAVSALANIATSDDDGNAAAEKSDGTPEPKKAQPRTVSNDAPEPPPKDTDKGAAGAKPTIAERCKMKADTLIEAIDAAPSFAEVNQLLAKEGLTNIDGMTWDLREKSALEALMNNDFHQYERVVDAYNARQEKDIAA